MRGRARSLTERLQVIAAYRSSGLSGQAFARREGIAPSTLYQWLVATKPAAPSPVRLARVVRSASATPVPRSPAGGCQEVVVEIGAARVRVAPGFDRRLLADVLEVLTAPPSTL